MAIENGVANFYGQDGGWVVNISAMAIELSLFMRGYRGESPSKMSVSMFQFVAAKSVTSLFAQSVPNLS